MLKSFLISLVLIPAYLFVGKGKTAHQGEVARSLEMPSYSVADTGAFGIAIVHAASATKILGIASWKKVNYKSEDFPKITLQNTAGTEKLDLLYHFGNQPMQFSEFRVSRIDRKDTARKLWIKQPVEKFESARKIRLGMTKEEVIKVFGGGYKEYKKNATSIIQYRITAASNPFLVKYQKTCYYGTYTFDKNVLTMFSFGFDFE